MATEYAAPFAGTTIATSQQFRDRNKMLGPDGISADILSTDGQVTDGGAGGSININNMTAIVQGSMYQLTAGPLNLPVSANGGGSNRFDIVCLTYDAAHDPGIYTRIVEGTPGAGLPALTFNESGVWDHPIAHYEKTPAGAIVNIVDRRKFLDPNGNGIIAKFGPTTEDLFPTGSVRRGTQFRYWDTDEIWQWTGSVWKFFHPGTQCPPKTTLSGTIQNTNNTSYQVGSPITSTQFIAPPSGSVYITVSGALECESPSSSSLSFEVRLEDSAGAVVLAASDDRSIGVQDNNWARMSYRQLLVGLTPRVQYYARTLHRTSDGAQQATIFSRVILVEPVLP